MRRNIGAIGLLVAVVVLSSAPARAEKRVALVVGNSAYRHVARLTNPANDARLMAKTLQRLGFTLVGGGAQLNLDKAGLDRAVQDFGTQLQGADVGLFYYAGHGLQVRGENYLVPVAANPEKAADVDFQMLDANLVLRQMADAGTKLNLMILDACRNNPFGGRGTRSADGGLATMQAPEGTLISFATQPGSVALDGNGKDSPFTTALVATMRKPGLDIFQTFNQVGLIVTRETGGQQQPWMSASPIKGEFYFAGRGSGAKPSAGAGEVAADRVFWSAIEDLQVPAVFEEFLKKYPTSSLAGEAHRRLEELKKTHVASLPPAHASAKKGAERSGVQRWETILRIHGRKYVCVDMTQPNGRYRLGDGCPPPLAGETGQTIIKPDGSWRTYADSGRTDHGTIEVINPDLFIAHSTVGAVLWRRVEPRH